VVAGVAASQAQSQVQHYHEPGHKSTDPSQAYTPPHQQLVDARPVSLIQRHAPVMQVLRDVADDCRCGRVLQQLVLVWSYGGKCMCNFGAP
jgi:hypothetical protein